MTRSKQKKKILSTKKLVALQLIDHTLCLRCWHTFSSENAKQQFATATDLRFNSISCCARAFIIKVPTRFGQKGWHLRLPTSSLNNRSKAWEQSISILSGGMVTIREGWPIKRTVSKMLLNASHRQIFVYSAIIFSMETKDRVQMSWCGVRPLSTSS